MAGYPEARAGQTAPAQVHLDDFLAEARAQLRRLSPAEALALTATGALLVDIRPFDQRRQSGEIAGAVVIDRNVLEWRLAPTSEWRLAQVDDREVILICRQGYASSLAARDLQRLGVNATDVVGGFEAWVDAALPVIEPDPPGDGPRADERSSGT